MLLRKAKPVANGSNIDQVESTANDLAPANVRMPRRGARVLGAVAVAAMATGALAIGAIAIGRLLITRARIRRLEIDDLVVGRLHVTDTLKTPSTDNRAQFSSK
jgi:hypothetical protein